MNRSVEKRVTESIKRKVVIAGYFGFGNTGDDAILSVLIDRFKLSSIHLEIVIVSGDPETTEQLYSERSIGHTDIQKLTTEIESCDLVILGGGGLFHDYWGFEPKTSLTPHHSGIAYYNTFCALAILFQKPLVLNAIGVGPLLSDVGRQYTRMIFEQAAFAGVRDGESKELLAALGVDPCHISLTADPAFLLKRSSAEHATALLEAEGVPITDKPLIGVCLREWQIGSTLDKWGPQVAEALDIFIERREGNIVFLPFQRLESYLANDLAVSEMVRQFMRHREEVRVLKGNYSAQEKAGLLAQCDVVVGMRLHSIIFAASAGVPPIGIIYDPKVQSVMRQLKCDEYAVDLSALDSSNLAQLMEGAYDRRKEIAARLTAVIEEQASLARQTHQALIESLENDAPVSFNLSPSASEFLNRDMVSLIRMSPAREILLQGLSASLKNSPEASAASYNQLKTELMANNISDKLSGKMQSGPLTENEASEPKRDIERPQAPQQRADVVCFSIIDWEFRYQRPQQIMSQFAAAGYRVFYISITRFQPEGARPRIKVEQIKNNLYEIQLAVTCPPDVYAEAINGEVQESLLKSLDELRRTYQIEEAISYCMIASWGSVALETKQLWNWRVVYDCMDEWENFPGIKRAILDVELRLVRESDLLVVTAQKLYEKWQPYNRPMMLVRNAVDLDFYTERYRPNAVLTEITHPVVGYFGAIADWFDIELVTHAARSRPDYSFVLLGGVFDMDVSELQALPNVRLLGQQPYETMPEYLYHFDACIIPFKINGLTEATDPVKLYEYLGAGKPTVSVALPELAPYGDYLYIAENREDFVNKLDQAVDEHDPKAVKRRRELAGENTWLQRFKLVEEGIARVTPRASIIIVTHNNLDLSKRCLESIIQNTEYQNYEVIVVDNASIDGTQSYLTGMATAHENISIILNQRDSGFAPANNQGIARSTGQYIMLLNSDTIVPPGWLSRLVRHLRAKESGTVDPLTIFVGEEARVEAPNSTLGEMEDFAKGFTWAHDNQMAITPETNFCVAFRREIYERLAGWLVDQDKSLLSQIAEKEQEVQSLSSQVAEADQVAAITSQLNRKERALEAMSEQLSSKEHELRRMTNTLGWRLLSRYGRIKYRYLLPIYRLFGLAPSADKDSDVSRSDSGQTQIDNTVSDEHSSTAADEEDRASDDPAAQEVARRFAHFRTSENGRFFNSLAKHLSGISSSPCLPMYFEFAITTNERGRQVADLLAEYQNIKGKRCLDVGCAYGGFLVAFAEKGADVTGIDVNESLLDLARQNFLDRGIDAPLMVKDATNADDMAEMRGRFDIITCNDVIEHVSDPLGLVTNIVGALRENGIAYFEIPNGKFPLFVMKDGHYQIFGITLLDCDDADKCYVLKGLGKFCNSVNYLEISQYAELFEKAGLSIDVLGESAANSDVQTVLNDLAELRAHSARGIEEVPEPLREKVSEKLSKYIEEVESFPRSTEYERREFMLRYGTSFWRVVGRKVTKNQEETMSDQLNERERASRNGVIARAGETA